MNNSLFVIQKLCKNLHIVGKLLLHINLMLHLFINTKLQNKCNLRTIRCKCQYIPQFEICKLAIF